ncbi:MAG: hypothetical protein RL757_1122 [Bacteroidota bacterium]|jgi:hypothetical protein
MSRVDVFLIVPFSKKYSKNTFPPPFGGIILGGGYFSKKMSKKCQKVGGL